MVICCQAPSMKPRRGRPLGVARLLTDLIDDGAINAYGSSAEAQLWGQALKAAGEPNLDAYWEILTHELVANSPT
ncbi:hypothetical protein FBY31_0344 [Arthrobacter sp. SLBN-100]|nr:hypothetical protein FBY31_0344 [Arthrobacter sp. SLBN-100]